MKKTAKIVLRVLLIVLCILLIGVGIVFGLNKYNDHKYGSAESSATDVTDISQYPAELNGIDVEYVDSGTFQGFHLTPDNKEYKGVIVCYGGSEGSPCFDLAQRYAEEGFESLAVFMFGMKNQPERLSKIPLEQFEDVLKCGTLIFGRWLSNFV